MNVINIGDGKNGKIPTHSDIIQFMKEVGWIPMTSIIWDKKNVSGRTAWSSFKSPSSPSFPLPFEYILIFCKDSYKLKEKGVSDLTNDEFVKWSLGIWNIPGAKKSKTGHPAAFPLELAERCVKMLSWVGSTVYDPFMGSGTTAVACLKNGRNYIGSEISENYVKLCDENLAIVRNSL